LIEKIFLSEEIFNTVLMKTIQRASRSKRESLRPPPIKIFGSIAVFEIGRECKNPWIVTEV
jgi:hypothetical protein